MITCNTASSKDIKEFRYFPLNSIRKICDFSHYGTDHMCLRGLKRKYTWSDLHFIINEKVKILHFRDENKSR